MSSFSPVEVILAAVVAIGYLAYWWCVVYPGQSRLRRWVEARYGVTIRITGVGHYRGTWTPVGRPGKHPPRFKIAMLRIGYFLAAFAVFWGAFMLTTLVFRELARR